MRATPPCPAKDCCSSVSWDWHDWPLGAGLPAHPPAAVAGPRHPRGWRAARLRGGKAQAWGLGQRLEALGTFARSERRRWGIAVGVFLRGVVGWGVGVVRTRPTTMVAGL